MHHINQEQTHGFCPIMLQGFRSAAPNLSGTCFALMFRSGEGLTSALYPWVSPTPNCHSWHSFDASNTHVPKLELCRRRTMQS